MPVTGSDACRCQLLSSITCAIARSRECVKVTTEPVPPILAKRAAAARNQEDALFKVEILFVLLQVGRSPGAGADDRSLVAYTDLSSGLAARVQL